MAASAEPRLTGELAMTDRVEEVALGASESGPAVPLLRIHFQASAADDIAEHTRADASVEQGGVLVGLIDQTSGTLTISGSIRAEGAEGTKTSLTFTHDAWDHIGAQMSELWASHQIVGWYHSHPGFGIFLSEFDRFICDNFFSEPWQVAYVIDPISGDDGFFARVDGSLSRLPDWDLCARMDAPKPERSVTEPVHRVDFVAPPVQVVSSRTTPFAAAVVGLVVGSLLFGVLFRSSPERVRFAAPTTSDGRMFVDPGSVAIGREGALYVGEPGVLRRASGGGAVAIAVVGGDANVARVPPVAVAPDGSVFYVDSTALLHRVVGSVASPSTGGVTMEVAGPDRAGTPWTGATAIATGSEELWILDALEARLWRGDVPEPDSLEIRFGEPIRLSFDDVALDVTSLAAEGDKAWILDGPTGRVFLVDGADIKLVAGGGDTSIGTSWAAPASVSALDLALTGATSIAVSDNNLFVVVGVDGDDAPAMLLDVDDEKSILISELACPGPLDAAVVADGGSVVVVVPSCTGVPASYRVEAGDGGDG